MGKIPFFLTILVVALLLAACRHETPSPSPATLTLSFGPRTSSAKSFTPEEVAVSSIKIEGAGPGGTRVSASSADFAPVELELLPGSWVITAIGMNSKGIEVASGFLELSLGPSEKSARDIILNQVAGEGSVSLSWMLAGSVDGVLTVQGSLTSSAGLVLPIAAPFSAAGGGPLRFEGLRNGSWTLELRLFGDGAALCGLADGVLVAAGMETKVSVSFRPPEATLSLGFVLPDLTVPSFQVEPTVRRVSTGTSLIFRAPVLGALSWYAEGAALAVSGNELRYAPNSGPCVQRIDCVLGGSSLPRSGSAEAHICESQVLGPLVWGELVDKDEGSNAAQTAMRALGDCRDLAWSPDGTLFAVAGKASNGLSLFETPAPGAIFARSFLGGAAAPSLASPSILRILPGLSIMAFSESEGAAYSVRASSSGGLVLARALTEACLAGAKDAVASADASCAYVAASGADAVALVTLNAGGELVGASVAAVKGAGSLASFSRPNCLALSPDGSLLAVGTAGDDAIYFFDRDSATNALSFRSRVDKSAFPAEGPLSDPCSLAFSPYGSNLFVLSYYGKALIRLDREPGGGLFAVTGSARSGVNGIAGFAYPKRLALSPDGRLLAVIGSGAEDGLSLFEVGSAAQLDYKGTILPGAGCAIPKKPSALAFSPDGSVLAIAADGFISLFKVSQH
jgi:DNA-binding beta-propeller fold protein YncE